MEATKLNIEFTTKIGWMLLLGLLAFGPINAQENILLAYNEPSKPELYSSTDRTSSMQRNQEYLNETAIAESNKMVSEWQHKIANFDLAHLPDFQLEEPSKYHVALQDNNANIQARYDSEGNVIYASERYKNAKLPLKISKEISSNFPGWTFKSTLLAINYTRGKKTKRTYKIHLVMGNERKVLKYVY
ncbi:hypothetical protein [Flagellimonas myxillae]|uniref:hypothetical protein n=1 Tax=Flagellimonas myxillae TaxID=2942214 RepID=UPI00201EC7BD|nr:hypothetical protein [Muricauda myxillae]MCL6266753.1 hypothetical protein [Muricauda myxillae]